MTVNSDSIQTLLKQRRQLRDCLKELKTEISALNDKASRMSEDHAEGAVAPVLTSQPLTADEVGFDVPIMSTNRAQNSIPTASTPEAHAEPKSEPKLEPESEPEPEKIAPRALAKKISKTPPPEPELKTQNPAPEIHSDPPSSKIVEDDIEQTLQNAILLAGFFLHHPSAAGNQLLNALDEAIQQTKALRRGPAQTQALSALKDAYRNVLARTYPQNYVTGQTISHSQKGNPYLFAIPMIIAALVLVAAPLLMLLQIITERQFTPSIADDFELLLKGLHGFVWGAVGALSLIAINITRLVRRRSYMPSRIAGVGLISAVGGLLGIAIFILLAQQALFVGPMLNYVQAIVSFSAGILSAGCLHCFLSRKLSVP